jgi:endonuclease YncB( thermonuclease family)
MRSVLRPALTALASVAAVVPLLVAGPLTPGQAGTYDTGKVTKVIDGDTVVVDHRAVVRLIGIDTPEHGQCGYEAATRALRRLVGGKQVVLRSDTGRSGLRGRPERRVLVRSGGRLVDSTTSMLERGLGVWMPRKGEVTNTKAHHRAADLAAAAGTGWFDEDRCGAGPGPEGALRMTVQWNADATKALSDAQRRNEEFIRIRNVSSVSVDIDGWTLRVGNDRSRKVPAGGAIPPGGTVTVHVGYGTNTVTDRYLGSSVPMLQNADQTGHHHLGSGAYLVDPRGDMRAHMTYPCVVDCADPTAGGLRLSQVLVDPDGQDSRALNGEYVALTNSGALPARTGDLVVEIWPWVYELPAEHVLGPGETVMIHGGSGHNDRLHRFLQAENPPLRNIGGQVVLRTYDAIVIDCFRWGAGRCPQYG